MNPRARAGVIHLALSAALTLAVFVPTYFLWYPDALFGSAGGLKIFLLIAAVNVIIGPFLTFIVFVPGKKGLVFDLWVIAIVQIAALGYGVWVLFDSRPAYIVFVKDRFELVRANQIPGELLAEARGGIYAHSPLAGPKLVAVRWPSDREESTRLMLASIGGLDIQFFPRHYVAYAADRAVALGKSQPLAQLRRLNPGRAADIDRVLDRLQRREDDVRFLPMRAGKAVDLTVLLDARNGDVLRIARLRPWAYD